MSETEKMVEQQLTENEEHIKPTVGIALVKAGRDIKPEVVIDGGISYNPTTEDVKKISLNTIPIKIIREAKDSLITHDFILVDVECVFYLRVDATEKSILQAAHSLGDKAVCPEALTELLEPKLDSALRAVAAQTAAQELLQNRQELADNVNETIGENLLEENGLVLENIGIIGVAQTSLEHYNSDDRFGAAGIKAVQEAISQMAKETEKLIMDKEVNIKNIDVAAEKSKLELEQDLAFKQAEQQRNIITYSYEQEAESTKFKYGMEQSVQEKEYEKKREIEKARIAQEQAIQQQDVEKVTAIELSKVAQEEAVKKRDIEKNLVIEVAQIDQTRQVQEADIQKNLVVEVARIGQEQAVQERDVEKTLFVEKAKIAQEEAVKERDIERTLKVEQARIAQEQVVKQREIEKNLVVEKAQIEQTRQVQEAEIQKNLVVEAARIGQEQAVQERDIEKTLVIEKAKIAQEEAVKERDIERTLKVEQARIAQEQIVQQRDIEKNLIIETAQIDQTRQVQEAEIQKNTVVEVARIGQEQAVKERDIERILHVEKARIAQEKEVQSLDIEKNTVIEKAQIEQVRQVREAEIRKSLSLDLANIDAKVELERRNVNVKIEELQLKQKLIESAAQHHGWVATHTKLLVLPLKHVNAEAILSAVKNFLSEHAIVVAESQTNSLIVRDVEDCVRDVITIIEKLDVPLGNED